MPHQLGHGASVYNGHLRENVNLTPVAECLEVELSLPVFTTYVCRGWNSNTQPSACEVNALTDYATGAVLLSLLTREIILTIMQVTWNECNCRQVNKGSPKVLK